MIFSMKEYLFIIGFCLLGLSGPFSFAQEYSSSSYERYVPLTDRAFEVKVGNLRSQVNSYEERLRRSRLRWNQLFQSQLGLQKADPAQKLDDTPQKSAPVQDVSETSDQVLAGKKVSNQVTSTLSNRYYVGFSLGAFAAQPTSFVHAGNMQTDEVDIEFDPGIAGSLELGRKFNQWSFSLRYSYANPQLSSEKWHEQILKLHNTYIPSGENGDLSFHNIHIRSSYLLDITPWFSLDLGLGAGYSFCSFSEMPFYPDLETDYFMFSAGLGARIAISEKGSINLLWMYQGSLTEKSSIDSVDSYLAEIGAHYYF